MVSFLNSLNLRQLNLKQSGLKYFHLGLGLASLSTSLFIFNACSVYQSEGRKYLEKNAFEYAGVGIQNSLVSCGQHSNLYWTFFEKISQSQVYANEAREFEIKVVPENKKDFACHFRFESAQELYEKSGQAVQFSELYLGPDEFANTLNPHVN